MHGPRRFELFCAAFMGCLIPTSSRLAAEQELQSNPHATQSATPNQAHQKYPHNADMLTVLQRRMPHVEFSDEPLVDVLDWFTEQGVNNLVVFWRSIERSDGPPPDTLISLELHDVSLAELLELVLDQASEDSPLEASRLVFHVDRGILKISTRDHFKEKTYLRTYDVRDLVMRGSLSGMQPFFAAGGEQNYVHSVQPRVAPGGAAYAPDVRTIHTGVIFGPGHPDQSGPDYQASAAKRAEQLIQTIMAIQPTSWEGQGGKGTIHMISGTLVISQTVEMHEIIGGTFRTMQTTKQRTATPKGHTP